MAAHVRAGMGGESALDPAELFAHVYSTPTPQLREQAALLAAELNEVRR
jgi:pyruvate dehydrogenase E1 component alpha subunit